MYEYLFQSQITENVRDGCAWHHKVEKFTLSNDPFCASNLTGKECVYVS